MTNKEMADFLSELRNRQEMPINEDEYYLLGNIADSVRGTTDDFVINLLDLDTITSEALTIYANEQGFTTKEAITNLIEYGLRSAYGGVGK